MSRQGSPPFRMCELFTSAFYSTTHIHDKLAGANSSTGVANVYKSIRRHVHAIHISILNCLTGLVPRNAWDILFPISRDLDRVVTSQGFSSQSHSYIQSMLCSVYSNCDHVSTFENPVSVWFECAVDPRCILAKGKVTWNIVMPCYKRRDVNPDYILVRLTYLTSCSHVFQGYCSIFTGSLALYYCTPSWAWCLA
jgi:hypothetical protein